MGGGEEPYQGASPSETVLSVVICLLKIVTFLCDLSTASSPVWTEVLSLVSGLTILIWLSLLSSIWKLRGGPGFVLGGDGLRRGCRLQPIFSVWRKRGLLIAESLPVDGAFVCHPESLCCSFSTFHSLLFTSCPTDSSAFRRIRQRFLKVTFFSTTVMLLSVRWPSHGILC